MEINYTKRDPNLPDDAEYWAEYELAYFALAIGATVPLDYVADMSEKQKIAWTEAFNDLAKERDSG
jgi:hypothetical protein